MNPDKFPKIISVDDHVIEPAHVWQDRLPEKYKEIGPRSITAPLGDMSFKGGKFTYEIGTEGPPCHFWLYEDKKIATTRLSAAVGFDRDEVKVTAITYDEMRPGCYEPKARVKDMEANWVEASLCFPSFPRFCGQTFMEANDMELADLCVKAYNDWMVDEWCDATPGPPLVPLCIIQLWDPELAAAEIYRNAARGVRAVTFSEIPPYLGLPSIHAADGHWDPFIRACEETNTVICMHIGSSSKMPSTSSDAPPAVGSTLTFNNAMASLSDWMFSGKLVEFPNVKLAYSEGQIGWIPYILERADKVWEHNRGWHGVAEKVPEPPSTYYYRQVYGCFFDDDVGLENLDRVGLDNITFETDYPHSDSTWPHSRKVAMDLMKDLSNEQIHKIVRGNAIEMLGLEGLDA